MAITTGTGIITIGPVIGVNSVFGQVDDRTYMANIRNAAVDEGTAQLVYGDADGRLGTLPKLLDPNAAYLDLLLPKASGPKPCPTDAKQAMLNLKVQKLQSMVAQQQKQNAQQQKQIETLTAQLKEQTAQIQKVSAQLELGKPKPQMVLNDQ